MVHTRGQGARPEGFSEYVPQKRKRRSAIPNVKICYERPQRRVVCPPSPPSSPPPPSDVNKGTMPNNSKCEDASIPTDPDLTKSPETPTGKRRREPEDEAESSSKRARNNLLTPQPPKHKPFFTSSWRTRSALSVPPKISILDTPTGFAQKVHSVEALHESPYYAKILKPTDDKEEKATPEPAEEATPQTPQQQSTPVQPGIFGSVRKIFGLFKGSSPVKSSTPAVQPTARTSPPQQRTSSPTPELDLVANSPRQSPENVPSPHAYQAAHDQYFKRRRYGETKSGQAFLAAKARDEDVEFEATPGSNKRKLASVDGKIPGPKAGGFGIDDSYLDVENHVDEVDSILDPSTPTKTTQQPQTPLRSALRQNANSTIGRSGKTVLFNPNTEVKHVYRSYGPAGQYHGSVFSDTSSISESSVSLNNPQSILSPSTISNTRKNETTRFALDNNVFDPNDNSWRPSLANPSPGHFRLPEADEYDDFDDSELSELEKEKERQTQTNVPPQPSTPRMSHAELPQSSGSNAISSFPSQNDSGVVNDIQETRLNKARSEAQKYKPARSSRLSHGEPARSRSSSPPLTDSNTEHEDLTNSDFTESNLMFSTPGPTNFQPRHHSTIMEEETPAKQPSREELDNTTVGEDGMTEYEREHQFDEWAKSIFDSVTVQTYEEAGIASSYIADLVRKNWTQKDTEDSIAYWDKEFEEGIKADREARASGRQLVWVTDPADMN
ncbi:hypothetical protein LTR84_004152 [Exophiala bonariae]|uniref:Uncharacterized protein n=1 Tax=Exophiala bonariae TaxID=1690606 RepID=A0AAV9N951_9EURO|nr:hypothetical protein LTR84_004152 [Exophiala bonariae]